MMEEVEVEVVKDPAPVVARVAMAWKVSAVVATMAASALVRHLISSYQ
jgi:hypothetical protein